MVISEPLGVTIPAGTQIWTRTNLSASSGVWSVDQLTSYALGESAETGTGISDKSLTGTIGTGTGYERCYGPSAIIGQTNPIGQSAVVVIGDSITEGFQDDYGEGLASYQGWPWRAFAGIIPVFKNGRGGDSAPIDPNNNGDSRRVLLNVGNFCISAFGTNNVPGWANLAAAQATLTAWWNELVARGVKVYQTTIPPRTTSTDSWATTTNQTPVSGYGSGAVRTQVNDWIRTTPAPLAGYIELADQVESARNSGLWKVTGGAWTYDGIHPNGVGHNAIATAVMTTAFLVAPGGPLAHIGL
jgi:lysophospholipase L1-like esterase